MNKFGFIVLLLVASVTWVFALTLSKHLAGSEITPPKRAGSGVRTGVAQEGSREHAHGNDAPSGEKAPEGMVLVSPESAALRKAVEENPNDIPLLLKLAGSLRSDAKERPSGGLVLEAVQAYSRALSIESNNPDALLGLATLCFEAGIVDKALDYFVRYLAVRPEDLQASTDYALALVEAGQSEKAISFLTPLAEANSKRFQMWLTLAVAEKLRGNKVQAKLQAERALENAPNDEAKKHINNFILSIDRPDSAPQAPGLGAAKSVVSPDSISPASVIDQYFSGHPIVGPKVKRIEWLSGSEVGIYVADFPVEQMPEFAKQKFIQSTKDALKILPDPVKVRLLDAGNSRDLIVIEVEGADGKTAGTETTAAVVKSAQ